MSYCRFDDDSDVYVFPHIDGGIICFGCQLADCEPPEVVTEDGAHLLDAVAMLAHLARHEAAGHKVPRHALELLQREAAAGAGG